MLPKTERQMTAGKDVEEALYRIVVGNIVSSQSLIFKVSEHYSNITTYNGLAA
jgi:hypothetical protein